MKRFGSKVNNFWEPGYEPESDKTAFKPKDVDKECFIFVETNVSVCGISYAAYGKYTLNYTVYNLYPLFRSSDIKYPIDTLKCPFMIKRFKVRDPVTNSVLKLKKLVKVKFIPIDDTISDTKRQAAKARWKV